MNRPAQVITLLVGCMSLGACASITRGTRTEWQVTSVPPGAAVRTSNGRACDTTPCSFNMPRSQSFTATIAMPGYKPQQVQVSPHLAVGGAAAFLGNAAFGVLGVAPGVVWAASDITTGATTDLAPNRVTVKLETDGSQRLAEQSVSSLQSDIPRSFASPLPAAPSVVEGRVVVLKVLLNGDVQEIRERSQ